MGDSGGRVLVGNAVRRRPDADVSGTPVAPAEPRVPARWARLAKHRQLLLDIAAVLIGAADVWLGYSWNRDAELYSLVLSGVAAAALVLRRRFPFLTLLLTVPGFFVGWSELAAMIALGTVARRRVLGWQTIVGAALVWAARFFWWPPDKFLAAEWQQHVHNAIYGCLVAGLPLAIALLAHAREELANRIAELAVSRERERLLHAHAIRADERARLAREMHDVVSHQVSLIAMQAGALRVASVDQNAKQVAGTIRTLSTRTLDELRQLVSVLRTTSGDDSPQPGVEELGQLVAGAGMPVTLTVLGTTPMPASISGAAYRTVQEALTNIRKYANGSVVTVRVDLNDDALRVEVRNGPPPAQQGGGGLPSGGHGLMGLKERANLLNGEFEAGATEDGGFVVRVEIPTLR
ncbi:histidine kinase [Umezawaea tangerina]|uniref:histidine kinase n=1 Tax=Umezawaea tangerina TaxID=84725 RepID=UPI001FEC7C7D|nr:histidine kinase [Umezawaea tangerina]